MKGMARDGVCFDSDDDCDGGGMGEEDEGDVRVEIEYRE